MALNTSKWNYLPPRFMDLRSSKILYRWRNIKGQIRNTNVESFNVFCLNTDDCKSVLY